jgi:hypothetical protein
METPTRARDAEHPGIAAMLIAITNANAQAIPLFMPKYFFVV